VGFDVLTTCQPSTVWCSRETLPAAAAQPAQGSSESVAPRIYFFYFIFWKYLLSSGHKSGYVGAGTKPDLDNHSNQMNPNNPKYQGKK
jgi:hypothetical protein